MPHFQRTLLALALALAGAAVASAQIHDVYGYEGANGDEAGRGVAAVGDVDADGVSDFAVGYPLRLSGFLRPGMVEIRSGKTGDTIRVHFGQGNLDRFGWSVDGVGDMNHDGFDDYIIGAPYHDEPGYVDCGMVYVKSGKTGVDLWSGFSVCGPGDLNADGTPDFVLGSPGAGPSIGNVSAMSGADQILLWLRNGPAATGWFGYSMDRVGDLNGDGRPELVVGAPFELVFSSGNGRGYVLNGSNGSTIFSRFGAWTNGNLGTSVAGIGDADGDGRSDYACSAPLADFFGSPDVGWIYLVSGKSGVSFATLVGKNGGDRIGYSIDGMGDLDGDGYADLIVGAPLSDVNGNDSGVARVYLNKFPFTTTYCTAKVNSAGCTPAISASGTPSTSIANNFSLKATNILQNVPGLMIWSFGPASVPLGGGTLCLSAPVIRTSGQFSGGAVGNPCSGGLVFSLSQAYMAAQGIVPGTVVHVQFWSRDTGFAAPNNMNLTDAIKVPIVN